MTEINRNRPKHLMHESELRQSRHEGQGDAQFSNGGSGKGFADTRDYPKGSKSGTGHKQKPSSDLEGRLAFFQQRLSYARDDEQNGQGSHSGKQDVFTLLASLEVPLAGKTGHQVQAPANPPQGELKARIETIIQTIGTRLDAELRPGPAVAPATLSLQIPADGGSSALAGFSVSMDNSMLTVKLVFNECAALGEPDNQLIAAAGHLAYALQARYPRRGVKILQEGQSADENDTISPSTPNAPTRFELSSLFRREEQDQ